MLEHHSHSSIPILLSNHNRAKIRKRKHIVSTTVQKVVTTQASVLLFGGLSKFAVTPDGAARAGSSRRVASASGDILRKTGCQQWHNIRHVRKPRENLMVVGVSRLQMSLRIYPRVNCLIVSVIGPIFAIMDRSGGAATWCLLLMQGAHTPFAWAVD